MKRNLVRTVLLDAIFLDYYYVKTTSTEGKATYGNKRTFQVC
ncbi:MAG: hypothetical protein A4E62_00201 [Syntrophorhabdus sp. PtaU1.Bin002]|nr:MAG: hypothetical protein A4E62_00201 [Syntrophorhabdus sp. PtaU1.Bin002]